jgi:hypothetical protein
LIAALTLELEAPTALDAGTILEVMDWVVKLDVPTSVLEIAVVESVAVELDDVTRPGSVMVWSQLDRMSARAMSRYFMG